MSIIESEKLVAQIIEKLANNGVRPLRVSAGTFFENVDQDAIDAFIQTIEWLRDESIIRTGQISKAIGRLHDQELQCVLTAYGFSLLNKKLSNSERLGDAVQKISSGTNGYAKAGELLGGLLGAFTNAISGS